jgi:hypothetical protein
LDAVTLVPLEHWDVEWLAQVGMSIAWLFVENNGCQLGGVVWASITFIALYTRAVFTMQTLFGC